MKHKGKKKHRHHKHKHGNKEGSGATSDSHPSSPTAEATASKAATSPSSPPRKSFRNEEHRGSVCEYCSSNSAVDGEDPFDCDDEFDPQCSVLDINSVTSMAAYELRSPQLTAFYCQSAAVLTDLHSLLRQAPQNPVGAFSEEVVLKLRPKLLALFSTLSRLALLPSHVPDCDDPLDEEPQREQGAGPSCPFVMVLSVLLPALHKFLEWVKMTKTLWWLLSWSSGDSVLTTAVSATRIFATQLQLHCLLMRIAAECHRLSVVIEEHEERDQDVTQIVKPQPLTPRGGFSSCSSSSSSSRWSLHSSSSRPGSATERDELEALCLPQVKRISFEFEELLAEFKFELADLSEAVTENVEAVATRLCRSSGQPKTDATTKPGKIPVNEFIEILLRTVLTPMSERVLAAPSSSRSYVFPRLVDRCICVVIDEYVGENGKWTEAFAGQFEKAIESIRSWSIHVEGEYDRLLVHAPRDVARLNLLSLDAFKRLDLLQATWLRNGKDGEHYVPRLTFRTNLENLRSTLKRTITARNNPDKAHAGEKTVGGAATPPAT